MYAQKSWDHMGCVCFDRECQTHYQLETQPVNHKQHIGGEELAGVLQRSSLGWQSSWSRRLRLLIFISCLDIVALAREDFANSYGSEALVLDNNKHSLKAPITSCVFTNGFISSPQQMFWERNLIIFYNSSQDCRPYIFLFFPQNISQLEGWTVSLRWRIKCRAT